MQENLGVMSDSATAMRDPVFYRWHKFIDWIFQQYKATQPVYTLNQVKIIPYLKLFERFKVDEWLCVAIAIERNTAIYKALKLVYT